MKKQPHYKYLWSIPCNKVVTLNLRTNVAYWTYFGKKNKLVNSVFNVTYFLNTPAFHKPITRKQARHFMKTGEAPKL